VTVTLNSLTTVSLTAVERARKDAISRLQLTIVRQGKKELDVNRYTAEIVVGMTDVGARLFLRQPYDVLEWNVDHSDLILTETAYIMMDLAQYAK
jgi:hypothetical protein